MNGEIKITKFTTEANIYRNLRRAEVDKLFALKGNFEYKLKEEEAKKADADKEKIKSFKDSIRHFDYKARNLWREICKTAETL